METQASGDALEREVAASLDAEDPALVPFLPELLRDLEALGSYPEDVVEVLRDAGLSPGARVLDLGCGKGASSRAVAAALGCYVLGVDGFAPFVAEAGRLAQEQGLSHLCRFRHGDLRAVVREGVLYDAVLLISVGPVFGDYTRTIAALRACVRPGGLILMEGTYSTPEAEEHPPSTPEELGHAELLRQLTAYGDRLLVERTAPPERSAADNARNTAAIERRAEALARAHPEAASALRAFVAGQYEECQRLDTQTVGALWLLKRGP